MADFNGIDNKLIKDIYNLENAELVLTESGGILTADGTEQNVYLNNAPAGAYDPRCILIDLDAMAAADTDTLAIKVYYRLKSGGGLQLFDYTLYSGTDGGLTDSKKIIAVELLPNRFGTWVTATATKAGGAWKTYDYEILREE